MKIFFIILIYFFSLNFEAKLKIEIIKGSEDLPDIAIVPFKSSFGRQFEYDVRDLINEKLTLFGEFDSLELERMLSFPFNEVNSNNASCVCIANLALKSLKFHTSCNH